MVLQEQFLNIYWWRGEIAFTNPMTLEGTSLKDYCNTQFWLPHWFAELFHDGGRYHIETSPLMCSANQWTGFYMITAPVMKESSKGSIPTSENQKF